MVQGYRFYGKDCSSLGSNENNPISMLLPLHLQGVCGTESLIGVLRCEWTFFIFYETLWIKLISFQGSENHLESRFADCSSKPKIISQKISQCPRKAHTEKLSKDEQVESGLLVTEKNSLTHLTNSPLRSYSSHLLRFFAKRVICPGFECTIPNSEWFSKLIIDACAESAQMYLVFMEYNLGAKEII